MIWILGCTVSPERQCCSEAYWKMTIQYSVSMEIGLPRLCTESRAVRFLMAAICVCVEGSGGTAVYLHT
jgi:hypothetical protein